MVDECICDALGKVIVFEWHNKIGLEITVSEIIDLSTLKSFGQYIEPPVPKFCYST